MRHFTFLFLTTALTILVSSLCSNVVKGQHNEITEAHKRSAFAIIDPLYQTGHRIQDTTTNFYWLYGKSELECHRLQLLRQRVEKARLKVGYPGKYHLPYTNVKFRLLAEPHNTLRKLDFRAVGSVKVSANDKLLYQAKATDKLHSLKLPESWTSIVFELTTTAEPPALYLSEKQVPYHYHKWQWRAAELPWEPAFRFAGNSASTPPHRLELPEKTLEPEMSKGPFYDFGREIFGTVEIQCAERPFITVGESVPEAMDTTSAFFEQDVTMVSDGPGRWISANPLAFRYVNIHSSKASNIACRLVETPVTYRGAFACSDSMLTQIWMNSAYTLRLCMQDFLLDGVKRDRLPWTGDMVMSMLVNAYTFADKEMVRRSLVALGREGIKEADINGIIDYSLWWIIAQEYYQLYYGDSLHLEEEWPKVKETIGLLRARTDEKGFLPSDDSWLFIDWVDAEKMTSLQVLWWWAQQSACQLAERVGDRQFVTEWANRADSLKLSLYRSAWNSQGSYWQGTPSPQSKASRHASLLAVISGLADESQWEAILKTLNNPEVAPVGTPYMAGFELMAWNKAGGSLSFPDRLKSVWGEMLKLGATTFWEAYDSNDKGNEHYEFYGRPYAKSLCHAWGAGPAALLPSEILNIRPTDTGWKKFTIQPQPGSLLWILATVPTPVGEIKVKIERQILYLDIPAGTTACFDNKEYPGPQVMEVKLAK